MASTIACEGGIGGDTEIGETSYSACGTPSLQVEAGNGYITVVSGSDGTIDVKAIIREPDDVDYEAIQTGDSISVTASEERSGIFSFGHSSGTNITITLRGMPNVNLEALTNNGSVKSELSITTDSFGDNHIRGKIGDGASELRVRTSNGSIRLE